MSVPLCESALQHWLPVCSLNGPRPCFSCMVSASRKAGTLLRPLHENCLTVCYASPTIFVSALDPFGELPAPPPHEQRDTYFKETYYDNLPRNRQALSALSRCGYINREQLSQFLRNKRIESYCKDGLIEKSIYSQPGSKASDQEIYRLTAIFPCLKVSGKPGRQKAKAARPSAHISSSYGNRAMKNTPANYGTNCRTADCPCRMPSIHALTAFLWLLRL